MNKRTDQVRARFKSHDPQKRWHYGHLIRVVSPPFNDEPYAILYEDRTGSTRSRPIAATQIELLGPRGGHYWAPLAENLDQIEASP
jgi:hypothetical protein